VKPAIKKAVVSHVIDSYKLSERRACQLVGISRTTYRYRPKPSQDGALRKRLKALAAQYSRYGYLMLHALLKQEDLVRNKKRTYRLYTEEGLQVRTKKRKRLNRTRLPITLASYPNERWSMDFVSDQLSSGRRFRVLNILDDYTKLLVGQLVAVSISGARVARFLGQLQDQHGLPKRIVCDNGTEFTSKAMHFWAKQNQVELAFIQPGKPTQNAFVESLNGKFRNECLNQHWFRSITEAQWEIEQWRQHYNHIRPHSSLNYLPPATFLKAVA